MRPEDMRLMPEATALVVIDIQERLVAAMSRKVLRQKVANVIRLLRAADLFDLPVMVTEQYPRGLGPTVPELASVLDELTDRITWAEKRDFSCMAVEGFRNWLADHGRRRILLTGIETHVCVYQTARDLSAEGFVPFLLGDATASRRKEDWLAGLHLVEQAGGLVTCTESVLFDLLGRAEGPVFKAVSRLVTSDPLEASD